MKRDDETVTQFTMRKIREEIIEECARVAEFFNDGAHIAHDMQTGIFPKRSATRDAIAAKIREIATGPVALRLMNPRERLIDIITANSSPNMTEGACVRQAERIADALLNNSPWHT